MFDLVSIIFSTSKPYECTFLITIPTYSNPYNSLSRSSCKNFMITKFKNNLLKRTAKDKKLSLCTQSKLINLHMAMKTNAQVLCWNSSNNHDTAVSGPTEQKQNWLSHQHLMQHIYQKHNVKADSLKAHR